MRHQYQVINMGTPVSPVTQDSLSQQARNEPYWLSVLYVFLSKLLEIILGLIVRRGRLRPLTEAEKRTVRLLKEGLYARWVVEGYLSRGRGVNRYPEWSDLNDRLYRDGSAVPAGGGVTTAGFVAGLEELVGERFSLGNGVTALIDGPASFEQRYRLIDRATDSIFLATWKIYADHTGTKTVDALLAKRQSHPDVDIRVMVDGNVAARNSASLSQLKRLVDGGIPVVFYHDDVWPFEGFHYKQQLVDGATAHPASIVGGMNIGDEYSHGYGTEVASLATRRLWRDTDVRIDGASARDDYVRLMRLWNDQISRTNAIEPFGQTYTPLSLPHQMPDVSQFGEARILTTLDEPGPRSPQTTTLAMLRAIRAASRTVDVQNAYFMDVPAIRRALVDAMKRGVLVRVLTNSTDSVDETVVCVPILKGLHKLLEDAEAAGVMEADRCRVYVRKRIHPEVHNGDTLHSKFMVVDQTLCQIASLNIHGRSLRLEVEGAHYILDESLGAALSTQFEEDLLQARRYLRASEIEFPKDLVSRLMRRVNVDPVLA